MTQTGVARPTRNSPAAPVEPPVAEPLVAAPRTLVDTADPGPSGWPPSR